MRAHDVEFTLNSGDYMGEKYGFTLAQKNGEKAWTAERKYYKPPSMVKYRIEMAVTAREGGIIASGAQEREKITRILEKLSRIADEEDPENPITLRGLDKATYLVRFDSDAFREGTIMHEKEHEPELIINVLMWGLYA